jgi:hypothetical protein
MRKTHLLISNTIYILLYTLACNESVGVKGETLPINAQLKSFRYQLTQHRPSTYMAKAYTFTGI